jgi:hypothetical protein
MLVPDNKLVEQPGFPAFEPFGNGKALLPRPIVGRGG